MKKFFVFENKDAARAYIQALETDGFERTNDIRQADFILYDSEGVGGRFNVKKDFIEHHGPAFIYPHTPFTCYIWDGPYQPLPVACNFVAGEGPKDCMKAYGYPYRVETVGFTRCEVLPFRPIKGTNLLFVPARPRKDKGRQDELDRRALEFIKDNRDCFDSVTISRVGDKFCDEQDGYLDIHYETDVISQLSSPVENMLAKIERADIVIAATTPAALAVARGKPTIMYGQAETPETLTGRRAKSFNLYRDIYAYPLSLEDMTIDGLLYFAECGNERVEDWKQRHIGGSFDREKFLSIVREYV